MKLRIVALSLTSLLLTASLRSASITWTGNTNGDFSTGTNWSSSPSTPSNGDTLIFTGTATYQTVDLTGAFTATNINLNSGNYVFTGTGAPVFTLSGNISSFINADFASSLGSFSLSSGSRTMAVLPGQSLSFHTAVTGPGALLKDGYGTLNLYGANTYAGTTTINAGTVNVDGVTASISHAASDFVVGGPIAGTATLDIVNGGDVTNFRGRIAVGSNDEGHVLVSGAGSTWANNDYLYVGEAGTGTLDITTGGLVTADNASIGNNGGGHGTVTVDGTSSWLAVTDTLYTGSQGTGTLIIQNGGDVTSVDGSIGNNSGGNGMVNVTGAGSSWVNSGNLFVGATTTGALNITAGASVDSYNVTLGNNSGGDGGMTVDGSGTSLNVTADLRVGYVATGTIQISSGAQVASAGGVLGELGGATGTVKISGSGSAWSLSGTDLYVGNGGTGILYVFDQGTVNVGGGSGMLHLGHSNGGSGVLKIGTNGSTDFAGGVINAATVTTGAGLSGEVRFSTTATAASPYYFTKDGTAAGTAVVITGPTDVIQGAGYNVLKGANTYSGATTITGGTLVVGNNAAIGASSVVVNGGTLSIASGISFGNSVGFGVNSGRLAGTGTFTNPLTLGSGGPTLAPGDIAPGALNFAAGLTANDGLITEIRIRAPTGTAGTDWDFVDVTGTLNLTPLTTGGLTLKVISLMPNNSQGAVSGLTGPASWDIAVATTLSGFTATDFTIDSSQFTGGGIFSLSAPGNSLILSFTPVPEPSTYALIALGLVSTGLAAWRRRRRA